MIEQYVKANCLSCLFNRNRNAELIPEPFRMQGTVSFRVAFQEYARYVLSLSHKSSVILSEEIEYLQGLASSDNPILYSHFLRDMAFAIAKEVWFSEIYSRDASVIVPATLDSEPSGVSDLLTLYSVWRDSEQSVIEMLNRSGFLFESPKRQHNLNLFKLAVTLYYSSNYSGNRGEINLVYDL